MGKKVRNNLSQLISMLNVTISNTRKPAKKKELDKEKERVEKKIHFHGGTLMTNSWPLKVSLTCLLGLSVNNFGPDHFVVHDIFFKTRVVVKRKGGKDAMCE